MNGAYVYYNDASWSKFNKPGIEYKAWPLDFVMSGTIPVFSYVHAGPYAGEDKAGLFAFSMVCSAYNKMRDRLKK